MQMGAALVVDLPALAKLAGWAPPPVSSFFFFSFSFLLTPRLYLLLCLPTRIPQVGAALVIHLPALARLAGWSPSVSFITPPHSG